MALTYDESSALMTDIPFRGRIKVACLNFAQYIADEAPSVDGHVSRLRWAQQTYLNPDAAALQVQAPTVMDPNVQAQGGTIPDDQLQSAVENTVKKFI
jgi:hypothetical protein